MADTSLTYMRYNHRFTLIYTDLSSIKCGTINGQCIYFPLKSVPETNPYSMTFRKTMMLFKLTTNIHQPVTILMHEPLSLCSMLTTLLYLFILFTYRLRLSDTDDEYVNSIRD